MHFDDPVNADWIKEATKRRLEREQRVATLGVIKWDPEEAVYKGEDDD